MEKLIIDRSKWRTGGNSSSENMTGKGDTLLLNPQGFMCCLGFEALRRGKEPDEILNCAEPHDVGAIPFLSLPDEDGEEYGYSDTAFTSQAIRINDDDNITPEEREQKITTKFKEINVEVEFIGEYVK